MAFEWRTLASEDTLIEEPRRATFDHPSFLIIDGERVTVTVLDITRKGLRLLVPAPVVVGETLELEFGWSGFVRVQICGSEGSEVNALFLDLQ